MKRRQFFTTVLGLSGFGFTACTQAKALSANQATSPLWDIAAHAASPIPNGEPLLRFVSVADTGTGAAGQYAVAEAMTAYYQRFSYPLVLLAGDNIYNNGDIQKITAAFERPYQTLRDRGVTFQAVLGNHDIRTANGNPQVAYPDFNMQGRRYYTITRGPVQFFALDTNSNADWSNQFAWLKQQLTRSTAPWKIVFGHHQIYASGVYGINSSRWATELKAIFATYQVPLYINGHEHHYERTQAIDGTTYLICGAGAGTRTIRKSPWTAYAASRLSFAAYEVYPDHLIVRGIGTDGQVFDQGVISRPIYG